MSKLVNIRNVIVIILISTTINIVFANQEVNYKAPSSIIHRTLLLDAASKDGTRILVGEHGLIFVSKDNSPWQTIKLPITVTLTAVFLQNRNLGWVVGHDAVIFRTDNGGKTWTQVYAAPDQEAPLLDLWFRDEKFGIAIGAYGLYLKTMDGGITWAHEKMQVTGLKDMNTNSDEDHSDDLAKYYDLHLNAIGQSDDGKMYIVAEAGRIYRSDNQGDNWQELPSPYAGSLFGILPLQEDTLLVFGLRGHLFRSDDAGKTWDKIETHTHELLTNGIRLHDGKIMIVGMGGTVLSSNDQGRSFSINKLGHRNSYSAVIENSDGRLILVGDHGMESYTRKESGIADE